MRLRHTRALSAVALVASLALTGCGQVRTGAAALIGDERIADGELASVVQAARDAAAAGEVVRRDEAGFTRSELSRLVNHELVAGLAAERGVTVSEGALDARLGELAARNGGPEALAQRAAENGLLPSTLRDALRDQLLTEGLARDLTRDSQVDRAVLRQSYDANAASYDQARASHILVEDKALADSLLAQVRADPSRLGELARQYSTDTGSKEQGGDLGVQGRGTFVPEFDAAVFGGEVGDVVQVQTQFGYHVIRIDERTQTTFEQAEPELRDNLLQEAGERELSEALRARADRLGITVNPRYGRYDADQAQVVPVESTLSVPGAPAQEQDPGLLDEPAPGQPEQPGPPGEPAPGGSPAP